MGFFFKNKKQDAGIRRDSFIDGLAIDRESWFQVFSACLGKMMAVQTACGEEVVKGQDWNVDFSEGVIQFGSKKYPLQFIGSESSSSNTWLWGWENVNHFPDKLIQVAGHAKEIGGQWKLEPLSVSQFELDDTFNGHNMSIVTCGLLEHFCYYRGPHSGGAIFVAFSDVPDQVFAPVDAQKFASITLQCAQNYHMDHKIFAEGFLSWNKTKYDWDDMTLIAHFQNDLRIEFEQAEEFLRIKTIKGLLSPEG